MIVDNCGLVYRLLGLKNSYEEKIRRIKLIDDGLLNFLEPKKCKIKYGQII